MLFSMSIIKYVMLSRYLGCYTLQLFPSKCTLEPFPLSPRLLYNMSLSHVSFTWYLWHYFLLRAHLSPYVPNSAPLIPIFFI
jgi:hypothetical protein